MVIVLHREFSGGTIGITLAGGADYESKEITVRDMRREVSWRLLIMIVRCIK